MDRIDSMKLLLEVHRSGSFSAAGRNLHQPLATVSRKISDLEAHFGARLFTRAGRQLVPTEAGVTYLRSVQRILEDLEAAERTVAGEYSAPKGDLVITAPLVFGRLHVVPTVAEFLKTYPDINIRLFLADRIINLTDDHVDIAIRIGNLPDSSMKAIRLGEIRQIVCASPDYLEKSAQIVTPQDISRHPVINFASINGPDRWIFGQGKTEITVPIRTRLQVNTAEAALDACQSGLGLTRVLSYQAEAAIRTKRLTRILTNFEPDPIPVHIVYPDQGGLPKKLRVFLDFASEKLKHRF